MIFYSQMVNVVEGKKQGRRVDLLSYTLEHLRQCLVDLGNVISDLTLALVFIGIIIEILLVAVVNDALLVLCIDLLQTFLQALDFIRSVSAMSQLLAFTQDFLNFVVDLFYNKLRRLESAHKRLAFVQTYRGLFA